MFRQQFKALYRVRLQRAAALVQRKRIRYVLSMWRLLVVDKRRHWRSVFVLTVKVREEQRKCVRVRAEALDQIRRIPGCRPQKSDDSILYAYCLDVWLTSTTAKQLGRRRIVQSLDEWYLLTRRYNRMLCLFLSPPLPSSCNLFGMGDKRDLPDER